MKETIHYFMWGWQSHFRSHLEYAAQGVFARISPSLRPTVFLVGVRRQDDLRFPVCVEPEDGPLPLELFDDLEKEIAETVQTHPNQRMFYTESRAMEQKPRWIRAVSTTQVVQTRLDRYDSTHGTISFAGGPTLVDGFDVVPVVQFVRAEFDRLPRLQARLAMERFPVPRSLQDTAIGGLLRHAYLALSVPEPGCHGSYDYPSTDELLRDAGRHLMSAAAYAMNDVRAFGAQYQHCNLIASLRYEGGIGSGGLIYARKDHPAVGAVIRFAEPVPLNESKWARKVLEMASGDLCVLSDGITLTGLGRVTGPYDADKQDLFTVKFRGQHVWDLVHSDDLLMRVSFGIPALPQAKVEKTPFCRNLRRVLRATSEEGAESIWNVVVVSMEQQHGTMVLVSEGAADEARRLKAQAMPIEPIPLDDATVRRVSAIDGAILLDTQGVCHAVGAILDGVASVHCTPSRGARYNSAVRYVESAGPDALAVVISEDGYVDVIPTLMPELPRDELTARLDRAREQIALNERADEDATDDLLRWLSKHRFYLDAVACEIANRLIEVYRKIPREVGRITTVWPAFKPNTDLDDSYFI